MLDISILASEGCFTVAGGPCIILRQGGDDDALVMPPVRVDAALDADLLIAPMSSACGRRAARALAFANRVRRDARR